MKPLSNPPYISKGNPYSKTNQPPHVIAASNPLRNIKSGQLNFGSDKLIWQKKWREFLEGMGSIIEATKSFHLFPGRISMKKRVEDAKKRLVQMCKELDNLQDVDEN